MLDFLNVNTRSLSLLDVFSMFKQYIIFKLIGLFNSWYSLEMVQ